MCITMVQFKEGFGLQQHSEDSSEVSETER